MSAPALSAAIDALAIALFEVRGLAYSLPRNWHALLDSEQGDYRGMAIDLLRQMKPQAEPVIALPESGYFAHAVQGVKDYRARVIGRIAAESAATCLVSAADYAEHFDGKDQP